MRHCGFTRFDRHPLAIELGNLFTRKNSCGAVNCSHLGDEIGNGQATLGGALFQRRGGRFVHLNIAFRLSHRTT
jgi:hypothetical protein